MHEPSRGTLGAIEDGEVTYTPNAGEFGDDSFTFRATDGTSDSEAATIDLTITRP
ncbi:cadherin-like domain-containing protein, partial [Bradyrhizobium sp. NBAIM08]|nr:cadherin-like domain-containing protein [Bradyrhizobium sp. NBAIM08]